MEVTDKQECLAFWSPAWAARAFSRIIGFTGHHQVIRRAGAYLNTQLDLLQSICKRCSIECRLH